MSVKHYEDAETVAKWYERQTGRSAESGQGRVLKIMQFLKRTGFELSNVRMEKHFDERWNLRKGRNELEAQAEEVGFSNSANIRERWWIVPFRRSS